MRFKGMLRRPFTESLKCQGVQTLVNSVAQALEVPAPKVSAHGWPAALHEFRDFSASAIEDALASENPEEKRLALNKRARSVGVLVKNFFKPNRTESQEVVTRLYAAIEIDVEFVDENTVVINRCYFSERYSPEVCAFMSAFDSGFISEVTGCNRVTFTQRITQGCTCCKAVLE